MRLDQAIGQSREPHNDMRFIFLIKDVQHEKVSKQLSHSLMEPVDAVEATQVFQLIEEPSELDALPFA